MPILIAAAVIALVCLLQALPRLLPAFDLFQRLEWITYDWRTRRAFSSSSYAATNLGGVFIDDDSLKAINDNFQFSWPWPRQLYGRLIGELTAEGAEAIAFDILFRELHPSSPDTDVKLGEQTFHSDDFFAWELQQSSNVVLAAMEEKLGNQWRVLLPAEKFRTNAWMIGHITSDVDSDGVLRRAKAYYDDPLRGRFWHMGIVLAARALKLDLAKAVVEPDNIVLRGQGANERTIPVDQDGYFYINWSLSWNDPRLRKVRDSFESILQNDVARDNGKTNIPPVWRGKIVVVGSLGSGNNVSDVGATPLSKQTYLVSKHWNVANSIITGRFVHRSSYFIELLLIFSMGVLSALLTWRLRALLSSLLITLTIVFYIWLSVFLFVQYHYWLPLVLPAGCAMFMTHVCMVAYSAYTENKERNRVRSVFSKIVSPNVVNELLKAEKISLGGARRKVTVYFADVRGFTRVTDEIQAQAEEYIRTHKLPPAVAEAYLDEQAREVLATVNLYLSVIADTVKKHNGTLDKYIGDCVMAFWGAPTSNDRHALECVLAAVDAQRAIYELNLRRAAENKRREEENKKRLAEGQPTLPLLTLLALGSGVNTGTVTVGLMGSDQHILNYTVFGREVNLASRLEGVSGRGRVIISDTTYQELKRLDPDLAGKCIEQPPVTVKGIRDAINIYEVQWREMDTEMQAYDTGILTAARATPPTDITLPPGQ